MLLGGQAKPLGEGVVLLAPHRAKAKRGDNQTAVKMRRVMMAMIADEHRRKSEGAGLRIEIQQRLPIWGHEDELRARPGLRQQGVTRSVGHTAGGGGWRQWGAHLIAAQSFRGDLGRELKDVGKRMASLSCQLSGGHGEGAIDDGDEPPWI